MVLFCRYTLLSQHSILVFTWDTLSDGLHLHSFCFRSLEYNGLDAEAGVAIAEALKINTAITNIK